MDILTLELFDVTVSQALREVRDAMDRHPGMPLRILVDSDEMVRSNLERLLERQGRPSVPRNLGGRWQFDLPASSVQATPVPAAEPRPVLVSHPPVLMLRNAFAPGDRALGRQLLLGVLATLQTGTPWVLLAHDALELLEDPAALECLKGLEARGIPVRLSEASAAFLGRREAPFPIVADTSWQSALGRGELTVL